MDLAAQITRLAMIGPGRLTKWESDFIIDAVNFTRAGSQTAAMSPKQVEIVRRLYAKHFTGETV